MTSIFRRAMGRTVATAALALTGVAFAGCEQKEKVLDIKTPNRRIEVERSKESGRVDTIETRKSNRTEIETPRAKVEVERSKGNVLPNVDVDVRPKN
jgi:hypothetical protein